MPLKETIAADLKAAMLARDSFKTEVLRGLKGAILNQEVADNKRETGLEDAEIEKVIAREAKKRDEASVLFDKGGNAAAAQKERDEKVILAEYLPEQMSEEDIKAVVDEVNAAVQPEGMKDMGKVIGLVKAKLGNAADGATVARLVKESLQ